MRSRQNKFGKVRIIGGRWRGRKLTVCDTPGLRPSLDRVRETLFNWLQGRLIDANCLDIFAGTGVLGLESISRGANSATFVEQDKTACKVLQHSILTLLASDNPDQARLHEGDAIIFLSRQAHEQYDIVFLDPPYHAEILARCLQMLSENNWLKSGAVIYLEQARNNGSDWLTPSWEIIRQGKSGNSSYYLLAHNRL